MSTPDRCEARDWVEIHAVLLEPSERSENLPPDTAKQPLAMWVKGFALSAASIGDEIEIETMTGRIVAGRLSDVLPGYFHTFGRPPAELAGVGRDLRERLAAYRARDAEAGGAASAAEPGDVRPGDER